VAAAALSPSPVAASAIGASDAPRTERDPWSTLSGWGR
jgi:hypothetical protein